MSEQTAQRDLEAAGGPRRKQAARKRRRGWGVAAMGVLFLAALLGGVVLSSRALLSTAATLFLFIALAEAWNVLGGYGGYLNLGLGAFFGTGMYTLAILEFRYGWPLVVTMGAAAVAAVLLAVVIGVPTLRVRGVYFAIITLIVAFLMQRLAFNVPITRGSVGMYLSPLLTDAQLRARVFYYLFLSMAALTVVGVWMLERTRFGFALVAIREDEDAASILGVKTTATKLYALIVSAAVAGVCGALFAKWVTFIDPDAAFPLVTSIDPVLMTFFGGAGTWQGPLIGAPLVVVVGEVLRVTFGGAGALRTGIPAEIARLFFGLILMGVALFARQGVMGLVRPKRGARRKI